MARPFSPAWLVVALSLAAAPAAAQPKDVAARAQALFNEATVELDARKYASACRKLEEVTGLLPDAVGARETLGECYEKQGKLGSAWQQYTTAAQLASKQREVARAKAAERQAAALRARAATMIPEMPAEISDLPGLTVSVDGKPMARAQWGTGLPVDAGEHEVTVTAPGRRRFEKRWTAVNGTPTKVAVTGMEVDTGAGDGSGDGAGGGADTAGGAASRSWQLPAGIAVAGAGLAALGVGAALGVLAIDKNGASNADGHCDATGCDDTGFSLRTDALALGDGSTAAFIAGGVLLAGGVVVAVLAPRSKKTASGQKATPGGTGAAVTLQIAGAGLSLRGRF